ncbi:unnamed protein product [Protopolystoma xenopodis]|uniref:Uncharacterized protein n=1 Tax=Protopolystoma xenopodis TaxID=117903 RepID=A0A3S5FD25_9PLAT|nr:unnamed protein product [Protopolystoma xenopodis]
MLTIESQFLFKIPIAPTLQTCISQTESCNSREFKHKRSRAQRGEFLIAKGSGPGVADEEAESATPS